MPKVRKTQYIQEIDHAYAHMDHQEWAEDVQSWKEELDRLKEILARAEKWLSFHEKQLNSHDASLKRHEIAVQEHGEDRSTSGNVKHIKDLADRRHELYGKGHNDQKIVHEELKRRHYVLISQLHLLAQTMQQDKF